MRLVPIALVAAVLLRSCIVRHVTGVTIDDLGYTEETCRIIRNSANLGGSIPCDCRLNTGTLEAVRCYPNCCPRTETFEGDRCHEENYLTWNVYEQQVCAPRPAAEYTDDTPNCFYKGNDPDIHSVGVQGSKTVFKFSLSILPEHRCDDLYVTKCLDFRPGLFNGFFLNTSDPRPAFSRCWLPCSPPALQECTATDCWSHRGITHPKIHEWEMDYALGWGDYALVCRTLMKHEAEGSALYQDAFSSAFFRLY
jgi:hypothetical protein